MSEAGVGLTAERLREVISYNPSSGGFVWRCGVRRGLQAGALDKKGYRVIRVDWKLYRACRLAWLYMHGRWPSKQIDHINLLRDDDRIENLREATNAENSRNKRVRPGTIAGLKGVSWNRRAQIWTAEITINGVRRKLGRFHSAEAAHASYVEASLDHGSFRRVS